MKSTQIESEFRAFLCHIAQYRARKYLELLYRKKQREPKLVELLDIDLGLDLHDKGTPSDILVAQRQMIARLLELLESDAFSDEQRNVFVLRCFEEFTYKEIASDFTDTELSESELIKEAARINQICKRMRHKLIKLLKEQGVTW